MAVPGDGDPTTVTPELAPEEIAQQLGVLIGRGVESAQDLIARVRDDPISQIKFAAACVLLAESLAPVQIEPDCEVSRLHTVHDEPAEPVIEPVVISSSVPEVSAEPKIDSTAYEAPEKMPEPGAKQLEHTQRFSKALTNEPADTDTAPAFRKFVNDKIMPGLYEIRRRTPAAGQVAARVREIELYLQGLNDREIARYYDPAVSAGAVAQGRSKVLKQFRKLYTAEEWAEMFAAYQTDPTAVLAIDQIPPKVPVFPEETVPAVSADQTAEPAAETHVEPPEPAAEPSENPASPEPEPNEPPIEPMPEPDETPAEQNPEIPDTGFVQNRAVEIKIAEADWREKILNACGQYWTPKDMASLDALLHNQDGEVVRAARYHLYALMAGFAPIRPGGGSGELDVLTRVEWETLNLLVGYNLPQGQKILTAEKVAMRLLDAYERKNTEFETALSDAVSTLVKRAGGEYSKGWYPHSQARPKVYSPVSRHASLEELDDSHNAMSLVLSNLLKRRGLNSTQLSVLEKHLTGQEVSVTDSDLTVGLMGLRTVYTLAEQAIRIARSNGSGQRVEKRVLTGTEAQILSNLMGNMAKGISPLPFPALLRQLQKTVPEFTAGDLRGEVISALRKLR